MVIVNCAGVFLELLTFNAQLASITTKPNEGMRVEKSCYTHPRTHYCRHGGSCVLDIDASRIAFKDVWVCVCENRWMGPRCEFTNPCFSQPTPCLHGGSCRPDGATDVTCVCSADRHGRYCEFRHPCLSTPCQRGGSCLAIPEVDDFLCRCPPLYTGKTCGIKGKHCHDLPYHDDFRCMHQGSCMYDSRQRTWRCFCPRRWIGRQCEELLANVITCRQPGDLRIAPEKGDYEEVNYFCQSGEICFRNRSSSGELVCECITRAGREPCQHARPCPHCRKGECDLGTGECLGDCAPGYTSDDCTEIQGQTMNVQMSFKARFTSKLQSFQSPEFLRFQETFRSYIEEACREGLSLECAMRNFSLAEGSVVASATVIFIHFSGEVAQSLVAHALRRNVRALKQSGYQPVPGTLVLKSSNNLTNIQQPSNVSQALVYGLLIVIGFALTGAVMTLNIAWVYKRRRFGRSSGNGSKSVSRK